MSLGSDEIFERMRDVARVRPDGGPPRRVAIVSIIEKLKSISNQSNKNEIAALNEAIAELELKQVELEMQNQELIEAYNTLERVCERYSDLYDTAPVGYLTVDHRLMVVDANMTVVGQLGTNLSLLIGSSFLHRVTRAHHDYFLRQVSRCRDTRSGSTVEVPLERKGAAPLESELTILPMFDEEGVLKSYRIIVADISERKLQERLIEEQKARLLISAKFAAVGEMAGNIAHEINNPLAIIVGKANELEQLVLEPGPEQWELVAEASEKIQNTAFRISKIIKSLLRLGRGGDSEPLQVVALRTIFDDALNVCQSRFSQSGVELRLQPIAKALEIECQPIQISQVITNLLNNAFDAVKDLERKWVRVDVEDAPHEVRIWVLDSGPLPALGIRSRIFEPFFTTKPINAGSGLGLSVSRAIIEDHGGTLSLETCYPTTSFKICLPKKKQ